MIPATPPTSLSASAPRRGVPLPPPRITARGLAIVGLVWSVYALLYSLAVTVFAGVPFVYSAISQVSSTVLLAAFSLPAWWLIVRGMAERSAGLVLLAHLVSVVVYTVLVVGLYLAWTRLGGEAGYESVRSRAGWIALGTVIAYVAQFGIYHAIEASRRGRLREAQAREIEALARTQELRTLRAQLNPHFLFNALNTISAQVGRDPHEARETVGRLADLMRYALDAGQRDLVPLHEEIAFVRAYLALEEARMGDRLGARVEMDASLEETLVPPMAIQTLVENAVRHGIAPLPEGGEVHVHIVRDGHDARVTITDTGAGEGASAPGTGTGLANTDERLRLLFGPEATLTVDRDRPQGWQVAFTLPASVAAHPTEAVLA